MTLRRAARVAALCLVLVVAVWVACECASRPGTTAELEEAKVVYVVDGDTLCVQTSGVEGPQKVRLIGVNCEESVASEEYLARTNQENTDAGRAASDYTKSLVAPGSVVWLERDVSDTDRYGRLLRYVWLSKPKAVTDAEATEKMLNAILVRDGYARPAAYEPDTAHRALFESLAKDDG